MSNPIFGGPVVAEIKEDRFITVNPGSHVEIWGREMPERREADVIERHNEFGSVGIPALVLRVAWRKDPIIITENGTWHVRVLLDAGKVGGDTAPEGAVAAIKKPVACVAVQFRGGSESAAAIVRWVAGKKAVQYRQDDELTGTPEAILLSTLEGDAECVPGSYIVFNESDGFYVVTEAVFKKTYEVKKS